MCSQEYIHKEIAQLFKDNFKVYPESIEKLKQAGSNRQYYRVFYDVNKTVIATYNIDEEENNTFLYFTEIFKELNFNVPEVYAVSENRHLYFIKDLGNTDLLSLLLKDRTSSNVPTHILNYYKKALSALAEIQIKTHSKIDYSKCYLVSEFNVDSILYDLDYFFKFFVQNTGIKYNESHLKKDFESFANELYKIPEKYFMYRDFQARNIMIFNEEVFFIDYQGARKGAIHYDAASLLFQAKAEIPDNQKNELLDFYINEVRRYVRINPEDFKRQFRLFALLRVLQTLGAYGNRGLREGKAHFIQSIPLAIDNLSNLLNNNCVDSAFKEINSVCKKIIEIKSKF